MKPQEEEQYISPVVSFRRKHGVSITGGYVLYSNPNQNISFDGVYICADYQSKRIWGIKQNNRKLEMIREIGKCPDQVVAFGRDLSGGIYAVGYGKGNIFKLNFNESIFE